MRTGRFLAAAFFAVGFCLLSSPAQAAPKPPLPSPTPAPDTAGLKFRAIGPAMSGGRVTAVAGSDRDPSLYYAGGAGGGVFKSTDGGVSFAPAWDGPSFGAIGALAVAPSAPDVVWAGTGESNPRNDVSFGDGVWVSRDGAKHWTHAGLEDTSQIAKILVDPRDPRRAIVAALGDPWKDSTARGVYRTVDGGKTWAHTLYVGPSSGAADLAWDPHDPRTVFASIWQFRREPWMATSGGAADGLYRSRDGGVTWTKIQGHGFPTDMLGRIGVAVARGDGVDGVLARTVVAEFHCGQIGPQADRRSRECRSTQRRTRAAAIPVHQTIDVAIDRLRMREQVMREHDRLRRLQMRKTRSHAADVCVSLFD